MKNLFILVMVVATVCMIFSGCSKSTKTDSDGRIILYLTDTPAEFDSVNIVVTEISVHSAEGDSSSGWIIISDTIQYFNLLELRNGAKVLFGDDQLEPGHYNQIRLKVTDGCNLVIEGTRYDLEIPSGYQSGIKITHQFWIEENETYELLLDFDAQKSIIEKGNGEYQLKPVIRAIPVHTSGSISGTVNPKEAEAFGLAGSDTVNSSHTDTLGFFKLVGLPEGTYSVQIVPDDIAYADSTFYDVIVLGGHTTNLGNIELRLR